MYENHYLAFPMAYQHLPAPPVWLDPSLQDITTIAESRSAAAVFHVAENRILSGWPAT